MELPMAKWVATGEWYDESNRSVVHPKPAAKEKLFMRDSGKMAKEDIHIISAGISLQRGKLPPATIKEIDAWLKRASKVDRRALKVVNDKG